jgi:pilus assembly protein FimV
LKFKLAEAYHGAKNAAGLDGLMAELRAMGADRSHPEQWQRLLLMSAELAGSGPPSVEAPDLSLPTASRGPGESGFETAAMDWSVSKEPSQADEELRLSGFADEGPEVGRPGSAGGLELETGEPESLASRRAEGAAATKTTGLEIPLGELGEAGLAGLGEPEARHAPPATGEPSTGRAGVTPESLGGASLDSLDITPTGKDTAASDVLSSQWQMDSGFWDEVATKVDLARAYMEMEDPEAARVILEEVVAEGTEEQKSEAREMLSRLD